MRQTISSIAGTRAAVARSAEQVAALGDRSREIGQIVEAIDDIAAQTNLLALNAAIEAARLESTARALRLWRQKYASLQSGPATRPRR